MLLPLIGGFVGIVLISPLILASWFLLPRRWMMVWPCWFAILFLYWISTPQDYWVIELPQGLRVVMVDTMDRGTLEGPNGFSTAVTKIGVAGDRVIYREGEGKLEPLATVYARQQSCWPEAICAGLALAPFVL